jgi:hypothetical protein
MGSVYRRLATATLFRRPTRLSRVEQLERDLQELNLRMETFRQSFDSRLSSVESDIKAHAWHFGSNRQAITSDFAKGLASSDN